MKGMIAESSFTPGPSRFCRLQMTFRWRFPLIAHLILRTSACTASLMLTFSASYHSLLPFRPSSVFSCVPCFGKDANVFTDLNPIYIPFSLKPFGLEVDRVKHLDLGATAADDKYRREEAAARSPSPDGRGEYCLSYDLSNKLDAISRRRDNASKKRRRSRAPRRSGSSNKAAAAAAATAASPSSSIRRAGSGSGGGSKRGSKRGSKVGLLASR